MVLWYIYCFHRSFSNCQIVAFPSLAYFKGALESCSLCVKKVGFAGRNDSLLVLRFVVELENKRHYTKYLIKCGPH